MRGYRVARMVKLLAPGVILFQVTGCAAFNEAMQTLFLGITAAGSLAILQNI